jgi:hypothetical protein
MIHVLCQFPVHRKQLERFVEVSTLVVTIPDKNDFAVDKGANDSKKMF